MLDKNAWNRIDASKYFLKNNYLKIYIYIYLT